jgi:hypothetical protein
LTEEEKMETLNQGLFRSGTLREAVESSPPPTFTMKVWSLLEEPESSPQAKWLSVFIMATIIFSIIVFTIQTMPELRHIDGGTWLGFEIFSTTVFTIEYVARLLVCHEGGVDARAWLVDPSNVFDFLAIFPFYVEIVFQNTYLPGLRLVKLFRLFRIFKLGRYSSGMRLMFETIRRSGEALGLLMYMLSVLVLLFGTVMFFLERMSCPYRDNYAEGMLSFYDSACLYDGGHLGSGFALNEVLCCDENSLPSDFAAISDACWLAIVTMTTVGYGDKYPKSRLGQLVGVTCMLSGVLIIALPTAIVGQKFQEVYRALEKKANAKPELDDDDDDDPLTPARIAAPEVLERIQSISSTADAHKRKLAKLQETERELQESLRADIRILVATLEEFPIRTLPPSGDAPPDMR